MFWNVHDNTVAELNIFTARKEGYFVGTQIENIYYFYWLYTPSILYPPPQSKMTRQKCWPCLNSASRVPFGYLTLEPFNNACWPICKVKIWVPVVKVTNYHFCCIFCSRLNIRTRKSKDLKISPNLALINSFKLDWHYIIIQDIFLSWIYHFICFPKNIEW